MTVDVETECKFCNNKKTFRDVRADVSNFKKEYIPKKCTECKRNFVRVTEVSESKPSQIYNEQKTTPFEWVQLTGVSIFWIIVAFIIVAIIIQYFSGGSCQLSPQGCVDYYGGS